jgi:basic membrane protein A and related proteins
MRLTSFVLAMAGVALSAVVAVAQTAIKPAIVYDKGGKFDKSFNEGVLTGAEKFRKETGVDFRDFEPQNEAQMEQALRRFARDGHSPIIAVASRRRLPCKKWQLSSRI